MGAQIALQRGMVEAVLFLHRHRADVLLVHLPSPSVKSGRIHCGRKLENEPPVTRRTAREMATRILGDAEPVSSGAVG